MLRYFIARAHNRRTLVKPRIIICVPFGITEVEKRAVKESAESAGAREVYLIEEPMAAAIGAGLPITEPSGNMVVDIGGGTTEVAVISLAGIVYSQSVRVGGDKMDDAISAYLKRKYNLPSASRRPSASRFRSATRTRSRSSSRPKSRGAIWSPAFPKTVVVNSDEIREALTEPIQRDRRGRAPALEKDAAGARGRHRRQGHRPHRRRRAASQPRRAPREETGLPVMVSDDPISAVVLGSGKALDHMELLKEVTIDRLGRVASRVRRLLDPRGAERRCAPPS
jgi:rod shape-determining protein MreB